MARKAAVRRGRKNTGSPAIPPVPENLTQAETVPPETFFMAEAPVPPQQGELLLPPEEPYPAAEVALPLPQEELLLPPEEPLSQPAEPYLSAEEPLSQPAEPYLSAEEPLSQPAEPYLSAEEPVPEQEPEPLQEQEPRAKRYRRNTIRKPDYLLEHELKRTVRDSQRSADAEAWLRQAEEEERERAAIEERQRLIEEEQRRLREQVDREVEQRTAAEERRLRREQEARIEEEVEKRLREAEEDAVPQIIFSPTMERAKRATVFWIVAGVLVLALVSILLGIRNDRLRRALAEQETRDGETTAVSTEQTETGEEGNLSGGEEDPVSGIANTGERAVYLTFDDGPSPVTDQVLDILKQYDVKATFFVVGRVDEASRNTYRRIVEEGHTLALHSYTHDYSIVYESLDGFQADIHKLQNLLYEETGVWCKVFRFPGGSSNAASRVDMQELIGYLEREGITYYDWNVYGGDDISPELMLSNVVANVEKYDNAIILLHDAADKEETALALPGMIEYIQSLDRTTLLPITDDTVPVQHGGTP